ncbi:MULTISPECIES: hypothetical protein [Rhizobium]|uniref:Uncharacterized protein n=2 Tax=Rhizobium TaxID=379 RepID=A0AAF1KVE6_9HYPH|nr:MULTISPECIES: hypothetical protein [Rhizobium]MBO9098864.1 hypothetical protein [Rhizobium sp. L58/93]MBO9132331.1 hypothetical protein [Rhizobium sp. B209b/85]MBO9169129.1 hypothetical protein [Rhizobium sp. L245/93]MBO9185080.1 hypothetical protein [Rhizobium sp. E27B/91]MBZ5758499.1 hypothetical protein [Rhizobium sp. VS19-DR96]
MNTPRFAYSSPMQAGERRTVRHVIGALRVADSEASRIIGVSRGDVRNTNTSYAF